MENVEIKILGTGCTKCKKLTEVTELAANELGIAYHLEKITDLEKIMEYGVLSTPALVVDGIVKTSGRVPHLDDVKKFLK